MPRNQFFLVMGLLSLSSCASYHGLKPLGPTFGRPGHYQKTDSLQPVLKWELSCVTLPLWRPEFSPARWGRNSRTGHIDPIRAANNNRSCKKGGLEWCGEF